MCACFVQALRYITFSLCIYTTSFLLITPCSAQSRKQHNLNHFNGLPSNNVYCMLSDKYGYLYIGTENGVVKYNGYSFKNYNIADPDVWDIYEDKKGRVWLYRISDEIGYIYNDVYHKVHAKSMPTAYIYPLYPRETAGGITFLNSSGPGVYVMRVINDTLYTYKTKLRNVEGNSIFLSSSLNFFYTSDNRIEQIQLNGSLRETKRFIQSINTSTRVAMLNNHLLLNYNNCVILFNTNTLRQDTMYLEQGEIIKNTYHNKKKMFLVTNKHVYVMNDALQTKKHNLETYLDESQLNNDKIVYMIKDSFWHTCISTVRSGMYMSFNVPHYKKIVPQKMQGYRYIGNDATKRIYWWSNETRRLATIDTMGKINDLPFYNLNNVVSIIPYKDEKMILVASGGFYTINTKTFLVSPLFERNKKYRLTCLPDSSFDFKADTTPVSSSRFISGMAGVYVHEQFHTITKGGDFYNYTVKGDSLIHTIMHKSRYVGLIYDSVLDCVIAYDNKSVYVFKDNKIQEYKNVIDLLGINRIKKILIDQLHGNVFFQDADKLVMYNYYTRKYRSILNNYKLDKTKVMLHNNTLVVAGRFGVMFSRIGGPLQLSQPVIYHNIKSLAYNDVSDLLARDSIIILNTDSGLLSVNMPLATQQNIKTFRPLYNFIAKYNDTVNIVHTGDTLFVNQAQPDILFDVVKPTGVGALKFRIQEQHLSPTWQYINVNEFIPSKYKPGHYYTVLVQAEDEVWKSEPVKLTIFLKPRWWQTSTGKILISIGGIAAAAVFALLVFYYTRKNAVKSHTRKNYLLSLELKSIYAQINPHFIFNTLTTGLYFISENRTKEAYTHISSFSELLRSYLKSSRNRYITLAEEIENIENYINLQQYRFEDKFDYGIEVDANIDTSQKHIPGLLLQPFVENAINHGLLHKDDRGHLAIKIISSDAENMIICIEDDGIGRQASKKLYDARKNKPASYGNELIEDLIKIINADNRLRIDITYIDKPEPFTGTKVLITVKEIHHE